MVTMRSPGGTDADSAFNRVVFPALATGDEHIEPVVQPPTGGSNRAEPERFERYRSVYRRIADARPVDRKRRHPPHAGGTVGRGGGGRRFGHARLRAAASGATTRSTRAHHRGVEIEWRCARVSDDIGLAGPVDHHLGHGRDQGLERPEVALPPRRRATRVHARETRGCEERLFVFAQTLTQLGVHGRGLARIRAFVDQPVMHLLFERGIVGNHERADAADPGGRKPDRPDDEVDAGRESVGACGQRQRPVSHGPEDVDVGTGTRANNWRGSRTSVASSRTPLPPATPDERASVGARSARRSAR